MRLAESVTYHLQTLLDASTEKERVDPAVGAKDVIKKHAVKTKRSIG